MKRIGILGGMSWESSVEYERTYGELVRGITSDASRGQYPRIIGDLRARGAQGVIAGCTEIELLIHPEQLDCPLFPTARLHALAAVDAALQD